MKIGDYFDRTYAINLPYRKDRRRSIIKQLEKAEMPIMPNKVEIFPAIRPDNAASFPTVGTRGRFLSELALLKQAKEDRLANVLIVEDDLFISRRFKREGESLVEQLSQMNWGLVLFGHNRESSRADRVTLHPLSIRGDEIMARYLKYGYLRGGGKYATPIYFYGVNGGILDRLISFLEELQQRPRRHPQGGPMHLDGAYTIFRAQNPDVVTLIAAPTLGCQKFLLTDIHDLKSNQWFNRTPVFQQLADGARMAKTWLKVQIRIK